MSKLKLSWAELSPVVTEIPQHKHWENFVLSCSKLFLSIYQTEASKLFKTEPICSEAHVYGAATFLDHARATFGPFGTIFGPALLQDQLELPNFQV